MQWRRLALVATAVLASLGVEASSVVVDAAANPPQTATASAANSYANPIPPTNDAYTISTNTTSSCAFDINKLIVAAPSNQTFANVSGATTSLGSSTFTTSSGSATLTLSALECVGSAPFTITLDGVNNTSATSGFATTTITEYDGIHKEDTASASLGTYNTLEQSFTTSGAVYAARPWYMTAGLYACGPTGCTPVAISGVPIAVSAVPAAVSEPNELSINGVAASSGPITLITNASGTISATIGDRLLPDLANLQVTAASGDIGGSQGESWPSPVTAAQWDPAPAPTNAPIILSGASSGSASFGQLSVTSNANDSGGITWADLSLGYRTTFPDPSDLSVAVSSGFSDVVCPLLANPNLSTLEWLAVPSSGLMEPVTGYGIGTFGNTNLGSPTPTEPCVMSGVITARDNWNIPAGTYTVDLSATLQNIVYGPS